MLIMENQSHDKDKDEKVGARGRLQKWGDSYDDALAESIIGLFKTEVIKFLGPWKCVGALML